MLSTNAALRCTKMLKVNQSTAHVALCLRLKASSSSTASCPGDYIEKEQISAKSYDRIPGPRGIYNIPFIGFLFHLKPFGKYTIGTMHRLFDEMIDQYGPIFKLRMNVPSVVITDPKDLATMVRHEGRYPFRPNFEILDVYYKRTGVKPNVGALQGSDWWTVRAPMQKMLLRPKAVSQYLPMMNEVVDDFIEMLANGHLENYNAEEAFMSFMAESAGTAFFNRRLGFLDNVQSEETKMMEKATGDVFSLILKSSVGGSYSYKYFRSKDYRAFESALDYVREKTAEYVKLAKADMATKKMSGTFDSDEPNMLMSLLKDVTEEEAALIMEGLYFASVESSAAGMQVLLHCLAKYQDKQEKLREEIISVVGDDEQVTKEHLDKMPYLKACLKEAYRCWAIIPFGPSRILPVDVVLGGYNVPAGVQILNYNMKACRDEAIFESPRDYKPERWLRQNKKGHTAHMSSHSNKNDTDNESSWAVLPFGVGPRSCPGRRLFEQEMSLVLTKLLHKVRVGLKPGSPEAEFEYRLFLTAVKPIEFTFTSLHPKNPS